MSDLQIGLISLGVVLIVIVVCFNWWQDRRVRQRMQAHFPEGDHDPLMVGAGAASSRREPGLPSADGGAVPNQGQEGDEEAEADPTCEAVLDIAFAHPVAGQVLREAIRGIVKVGAKPVRVMATDDAGAHRLSPRDDGHYVSLQLAVLLANRGGPLTDIEWSQLWSLAQSLAEQFEGAVEGPEQEHVLARARELDALCASLDAQVGLAVKLGGTLPIEEVAKAVRDAGFLVYGRQLAWMSEAGIPRFTILFDGLAYGDVQSAGVDRLDLLLDLPHSPADAQAFSRMASVGRDLAARLAGELVDDQGRPLAEGRDQSIDVQLAELYGKLQQHGLPAGEMRTVRLFS